MILNDATRVKWVTFLDDAIRLTFLIIRQQWWKVLRSLALKGRRFENWQQVCKAVEKATQYWNEHRHPFVWGRKRHRRPARQSGKAAVPNVR